MKKIFLVLSIMFISASAYAIEYSVGVTTPGFGLAFLRGNSTKSITEADAVTKASGISLAPGLQLDVMFEFLPFLALETGLGYTISSAIYEPKSTGGAQSIRIQSVFRRHEATIPIMIRGQYEFERFLTYGSVGVRLGIPLSKAYAFSRTLEDGKETDASKKAREDSDTDNYSDLAMDIAFAIGGEYRITGAHYIGLRLGYDLNVISPANAREILGASATDAEVDDYEWYQDNFNVSLSYRYAFGSKWNN